MGRITLPRKISKWSIVKLFTLAILISTGYYFYPTFFKSSETGGVLAASTDVFGSFNLATIEQYPVINYPDGKTVPLQDRFSVIRKYSSPTKFTNHLCNTVNAGNSSWRNDTIGCKRYVNKNPLFIKLDFGSTEKLVLYNFYGLYSINSQTNTIKWQSAHIDRFQNATKTYSCGWTYDPSAVIPVKSGNNFYLFSRFSGLNSSLCLQFFDDFSNKPSISSANTSLYLGYQINSNGEVNLSTYKRDINLAVGGPFGAGPKNATSYATSPQYDVFGCAAFDSDKRCTSIKGLSTYKINSAPNKTVDGGCELYGTPYPEYKKCITCDDTTDSDGYKLYGSCNPSSGSYPKYPGSPYVCKPSPQPTGGWITPCLRYKKVPVYGYLKTSVNTQTFSNFSNFSRQVTSWNIDNPKSPVPYMPTLPADYLKFNDEVMVNSTSNALNYTKDLNLNKFVSNRYMYSLEVIEQKTTETRTVLRVVNGRLVWVTETYEKSLGHFLRVNRFSLTTTPYDIGGTSYIQSSNYTMKMPVSSTNTDFSLQYFGNDIYILASGGNSFKLYKVENLNSSSGTISYKDITAEVTSKISTIKSSVFPTAIGIVDSKIYLVVNNQVYYSTIGSLTCTPNFNLSGGGLSLVNTNPNSMNFGVPVSSDLADDPYLYNLNFSFNSKVTINCPNGNFDLPTGTDISLTLYDGITSVPLTDTLSTDLLNDGKSFNFADVELDYFKKYYYRVSFKYNGETYYFPSSGVDTNRYFTLESYLNLNTYLDGEFPTELPDSKMVITKTFNNNQRQYTLSSPVGDYQFTLISQYFPNFFWDHNMVQSGNNLNDTVIYRVCFTNTPDTKVSRVGFSGQESTSATTLSNNYFTGTINNGCLDLNYKTNTIASYNVVPQSLDVYLTTTTIPEVSTKVNFRVNGNLMIKNTTDVKSYNASTNDKKYQGSYLASTLIGDKGYALSLLNKNQYFKIPYYSKLTNALNFSWTEDLVTFTDPSTLDYTETKGILLTDNNSDVSSSNFDKIDVFTAYQPVTPTIIYVAKNKYLYFDLTDTNIFTPLENTYFVSTDGSNTQERIVFNVDCSSPDYSYICTLDYEYHMKGGIYGDFKLVGNKNTKTQNKAFINIHQNPEILILLQKDLRSNKIFNVTRSKTIFKYLND